MPAKPTVQAAHRVGHREVVTTRGPVVRTYKIRTPKRPRVFHESPAKVATPGIAPVDYDQGASQEFVHTIPAPEWFRKTKAKPHAFQGYVVN